MLEKVLNDEDVVTIALGNGGIDVRINELPASPRPGAEIATEDAEYEALRREVEMLNLRPGETAAYFDPHEDWRHAIQRLRAADPTYNGIQRTDWPGPEASAFARYDELRRGRLRDIATTIFLAAVTSRGLIYIGQAMGWW